MIRVGIIGCGKIAQVRHLPEYAANPNAEIVAFYDKNMERAQEMAAQYGGKVYDTYFDLLNRDDIDAVSICVENRSHAEISTAALYAGKHVLCEKPMAVTLAECESMVAAAERNGRHLMIGHNMRFDPVHRRAKQLLDSGYIRIEDGSGGRGTLRKIFTVEVCPRNPVNPDGVNPAKSDGVINNNCNNNKINNKARAPKAYLTDQELLDWFNNWAVRLDADPEETTKLIGDLHAFAEMRKAKKKPILTVNAAGRHAKKLLDYSADFPEYRLAAMRYVLSQSVESNWEKLYPITKPDNFNR